MRNRGDVWWVSEIHPETDVASGPPPPTCHPTAVAVAEAARVMNSVA